MDECSASPDLPELSLNPPIVEMVNAGAIQERDLLCHHLQLTCTESTLSVVMPRLMDVEGEGITNGTQLRGSNVMDLSNVEVSKKKEERLDLSKRDGGNPKAARRLI